MLNHSIPTNLLLALLLAVPLAAQPTFTRIVFQDDAPMGLAPRAENVASDGSIYITRKTLTPVARQRLLRGLGFRHVYALDARSPGPAVLSLNPLLRLPGEARLRFEYSDIALHVLGHGASAAESRIAAESEPLPRGMIFGAAPEAEVPEGWRRVGEPTERPVVWVREVQVMRSATAGGRRELGIMDGLPRDTKLDRRTWMTRPIAEQGPYPMHLQGIARDADNNFYWSWTDRIVKTDRDGKVLIEKEAEGHQGDLTWHRDRLVVAVNLGKFNDLDEGHDSWAYVYDPETLQLEAKHRLPEARFGAGGICWAKDRFVVVGGLPEEWKDDPGAASNEIHEYDWAFRHLRTRQLPSGWTHLGIQTAEFAHGRFYFGCYGDPRVTLIASPQLDAVRTSLADTAYGVVAAPGGIVFSGHDAKRTDGHYACIWFSWVR